MKRSKTKVIEARRRKSADKFSKARTAVEASKRSPVQSVQEREQ